MINTGVNVFLVNNKSYLHNAIECASGIGVTGGIHVNASLTEDLYFLLESPKLTILIKVTDINCLPSNYYNAFSLGLLKQIEFKDTIHIFDRKIKLVDPSNNVFHIPVAFKDNNLDFVNIKLIPPSMPIPSCYSMITIQYSFLAHHRLIHASSIIMHRMSLSKEINHMPYIPSTPLNYPICLCCKMTQSISPTSNPD